MRVALAGALVLFGTGALAAPQETKAPVLALAMAETIPALVKPVTQTIRPPGTMEEAGFVPSEEATGAPRVLITYPGR